MAEEGMSTGGAGRLIGAENVVRALEANTRALQSFIARMSSGGTTGGGGGGTPNGGATTGGAQGGGPANNGGSPTMGGQPLRAAGAAFSAGAGMASLAGRGVRAMVPSNDQKTLSRQMAYVMDNEYAPGRPNLGYGRSYFNQGFIAAAGGVSGAAQTASYMQRTMNMNPTNATSMIAAATGVTMADSSVSTMRAAKGMAANASLSGTAGLRMMGISTYDNKGHRQSPNQIAEQVLAQCGLKGKSFKPDEISYIMNDPRSGLNTTLNNWLAQGFIQAAQFDTIHAACGALLRAQNKGMDAKGLDTLMRQRNSTDSRKAMAATRTLKSMGIEDSQEAADKRKLASEQAKVVDQFDGFARGMKAATDNVTAFNTAVRHLIHSIPGLDFISGLAKGGFSEGKKGVFGGLGAMGIGAAFGPLSGSVMGMAGSGLGLAAKGLGMVFGGAISTNSGLGGENVHTGSGAHSGSGGGGSTHNVGSGSAGRPSSGVMAAASRNKNTYGGVKPWVAAAGHEIEAKFHPRSVGGVGGRSYTSDHPKGLALDFMVSSGTAKGSDFEKGTKIANYAVANRGRLGITYVIWFRRIFHTWGKWGPYSYPGAGSSPTTRHEDHVHVSFDSKAPSGYSGGGGGQAWDGKAGGGSDLSSGSTPSSGSTAATAGTSSPGAATGPMQGGYYSEAAAIAQALSGGGGGPGVDGFMDAGTSSSGNGMGGLGPSGTGGRLTLGTMNLKYSNSSKRWGHDLDIAMGRSGVFGLQEVGSKDAFLRKYLAQGKFGLYRGRGGDTGVAWDKDRYSMLQGNSFDLSDSVKFNGKHMPTSASYVLMQDKKTGNKFWVVSSHLQAHLWSGQGQKGIAAKQRAELASLYARLRNSGVPVFNVGDFNSGGGGDLGKRFKFGLDSIYGSGAKFLGGGHVGNKGGSGDLSGRDGTYSDHPFVFGNYALPGGGNGSSNGGGRSGKYNPGGGVGQWRDEVIFAMRKLGVKPTKNLVDLTLMQMRTESSGNPGIVNKWDSNWKAGHPSVGLMQVIEGTFNAYAGPYKGRGPKKYGVSTDPIANIYASLNYALHRYGSLQNAFHGHGYKKGAWEIQDDEVAQVHKGEMIIPPREADTIRQVLTQGGGSSIHGKRRGGGGITFMPNSIQITLGAGVSPTVGRALGKELVDAITTDSRIKAMMEGSIHA